MGDISWARELNPHKLLMDVTAQVLLIEQDEFERIDDYTRSLPTGPSPGRVYRKNLMWDPDEPDNWQVYFCREARNKDGTLVVGFVDHVPYQALLVWPTSPGR